MVTDRLRGVAWAHADTKPLSRGTTGYLSNSKLVNRPALMLRRDQGVGTAGRCCREGLRKPGPSTVLPRCQVEIVSTPIRTGVAGSPGERDTHLACSGSVAAAASSCGHKAACGLPASHMMPMAALQVNQ